MFGISSPSATSCTTPALDAPRGAISWPTPTLGDMTVTVAPLSGIVPAYSHPLPRPSGRSDCAGLSAVQGDMYCFIKCM